MSDAAPPPIRFAGGEVVLADTTRTTDLRVEGGHIAAVGAMADPVDDEVIDASGLRVCPGLVDLQVNGGQGIDLAREPDRLWELGSELASHGVTSWLPTIVTSPSDQVDAAIEAFVDRPADHAGAVPLGLHLEGPMLNPARAGAHPVALLREPSPALVSGWTRERGVAMVTIAPELAGALEVIATLRERGVVVAIGHTDAGVEEVDAACAAGATHVTHLYNAMSPLHHREPGVVGAALVRPDLTAGLVVDGLHAHAYAVRLAWRAMGPSRLALVSDAAPARGLPPGPSTLGAVEIVVGDSGIRTTDGTLAGSDLTLDAAVRNLVGPECTWADAVRAASTVPAGVLSAAGKGVIAAGADADLVVLDPELRVVLTMVAGHVVHDPEGLAAGSVRRS